MLFSLRSAATKDTGFCKQLYIESMLPVMAGFAGWDAGRLEKNFATCFQLACTRIIEAPLRCGWIQLEENAQAAFISFIYLDPPMRGQGIGRRIITQAMQDARARNRICAIRCARTNEGALRLYKSLGFRITSEDNLKYFLESV